MERREFLKRYGVQFSLGVGLATASTTAGARPAPDRKHVDPERFGEIAYQHFIPGKLTCGESILLAGCEALGIKSDLVPDIGLGLAGGLGLQGQACGVLTGSAMILSLAVAQGESEYPKKKMRTWEAVGRLHDAFKARFGSVQCRTLSGLDLTTPQDRQKLKESVKAQTCANFVRAGAELLARELQRI
jgi:C_GCAxxG_C_C family probable redox protein